MKITTPFDSAKEVKPLIEAGADELYCGVFSSYWERRRLLPNARPSIGNLSSFRELETALRITKSYKVPVFLCANSYLNKGAYDSFLKDISLAIKLGVDGFILSDPTLIHFIKQSDKNSKIILSCLNPCFNSKALEFFSELGVNRVVLDRQLTLGEIKSLSIDAQQANIELEVFIHNIVCRHINGNCLFHKLGPELLYSSSSTWGCLKDRFTRKVLETIYFHRKKVVKFLFSGSLKLHACRRKYRLEVLKDTDNGFNREKMLESFCLDREFSYYCAVCSLYFLKKYGISSVKIIGRGLLTPKKIKDVRFVRRYLDELKTGFISEYNFLLKGRNLHREVYGRECKHNQCHHWEVYKQRLELTSDDCKGKGNFFKG
jgi:putative protease